MEEETAQQFILIPPKIMADKKLTDKQKILYGVIYALHNEKGYCYASNAYLGKRIGSNISNTSKNVKALELLGYLKVEKVYKETKEFEERKIYPLLSIEARPLVAEDKTPCREKQDPLVAGDKTLLSQKTRRIINNNNKFNNKLEGWEISINQSLIDEFKRKHPKIKIEQELQKAKNYLEMTGKKYKSYIAFYRNWLIKAQEFHDEKYPKSQDLNNHQDIGDPKFVEVNQEKLEKIRSMVKESTIGVIPTVKPNYENHAPL